MCSSIAPAGSFPFSSFASCSVWCEYASIFWAARSPQPPMNAATEPAVLLGFRSAKADNRVRRAPIERNAMPHAGERRLCRRLPAAARSNYCYSADSAGVGPAACLCPFPRCSLRAVCDRVCLGGHSRPGLAGQVVGGESECFPKMVCSTGWSTRRVAALGLDSVGGSKPRRGLGL